MPVKNIIGSSWFQKLSNLPRSNATLLKQVEQKILSYLQNPYEGWFVDIGKTNRIWTISLNNICKNTPLVLIHGLGLGVATWCLNLDELSRNRPVYALDLLGFGRSSRPVFSSNGLEAEQQMVQAIEEWRRALKLDEMILLGHSMGGFLASSYAISHPGRIKHLILADTWGFPEKPPDVSVRESPFWMRTAIRTLRAMNPLWPIRAAGPFGPWIINKIKPDIPKRFENFLPDPNIITEYVYRCNTQVPTGERAFRAMTIEYPWARYPMEHRIHELHEDVPITVLYGSRTWVNNSAARIVQKQRKDSYVNVIPIYGAGHHVYADKPDLFNKYVVEICKLADMSTRVGTNIKTN